MTPEEKFQLDPDKCPYCGSNHYVPTENHYDEDGCLHIYYACECEEMWWAKYKAVVLEEVCLQTR